MNNIPTLLQDCLAQTKIELLSVHIPKTAGTAFFHHLKAVYSNESVLRLDVNQRKETIFLNQQPVDEIDKLDSVKVIHGHFSTQILIKSVPLLVKEIPIITWLRDPVERIVSNYNYLTKRLQEELKEEKKGLDILSKMQRSLLEYARLRHTRNVQAHYFRKINMEDLFFIGLQEHYEEDIAELGKLLNWPEIETRKLNVTGVKYELSSAERAEIEELNAMDVAFYKQAIELRMKRSGNAN